MSMNPRFLFSVLCAFTLGCGGTVDDAREASGASGAGAGGSGSAASTGGGPACADGATCNDGDACTTNDSCASGVCSGTKITCDTPPPSECTSATTLRTYGPTGVCDVGACAYPPLDTTCPDGCTAGACNSERLHLGQYHGCAMTSAGGVECWGEWKGYGDGFTYTTVPEAVTGLDSGVVAIGGGPYHTCAILSTGAPRCWGWNQYGDLGNGVSGSVNTPIHVEVSGLGSGVIAIVGGQMHSCALTAVRGVKCWGRNNHGQLGDGSTTDSLVPVDVTGLESGVIAIRGAPLHTCVLTSSGGVKCWGLNWEGRLGNGSTTDSPVPVDVLGLKAGVIALGTGWRHTCAITKAGVKCWGSNDFGELGDGTTMDSSVPVDVSGLDSAVIAIRGGIDHTCALTASGGIQCWGNNFDGQLGNDSIETSSAPVHVKGLDSGEVAVAAGMSHTCALASTGGVQCWGENFRGQLGNNSTKGSLAPVNVVGF